jgi:spermidine/putrescine transport system permease protein
VQSPSTVATKPPAQTRPLPAVTAQRSLMRRLWRAMTRNLVVFYALLAMIYLFLPVVVVVVFSFNAPAGRFNFNWHHFSLHSWRNPCGIAGLCPAMVRSVQIAALATIVATAIGTMVAFALVRHRFTGRRPTNLLVFLPMATPEVVLGSSLLALFLNLGIRTGFGTILIGHILFNISYVVVTVKARLQGMDSTLEQAAMDLYADEWQAFRRVTLPLVTPGIIAASLLAFALSFDDFIVANFNAGSTVTFPMFVWGAAQRGLPPQINVMGTLVFAIALTCMMAGVLISRRRA